MIMGIDHGYYAIKTRHFSFPAGVTAYTHEPYTLKNTLQIGGKYYVCGTGRQPILRDKTVNDNYYILTLAAIAMELRCRGLPAESSVTLAAGLPLARYGRDKKLFTEYLLRNGQPVSFLFEGERYKVKIENVKLFPQGYSAIAIHPELVKDEPSVLLMDIGGWTVDLMRLDNNVPIGPTGKGICSTSRYTTSLSIRILCWNLISRNVSVLPVTIPSPVKSCLRIAGCQPDVSRPMWADTSHIK